MVTKQSTYSISVFFFLQAVTQDTGQVAGSSDNNDKTHWETFQTVAYTGESTEYRSFEEIRYFPLFESARVCVQLKATSLINEPGSAAVSGLMNCSCIYSLFINHLITVV